MNNIYEQKAKKYKYKYLKLKAEYIGGGGDSTNMRTRIQNWFTPNIWKERQNRLQQEKYNKAAAAIVLAYETEFKKILNSLEENDKIRFQIYNNKRIAYNNKSSRYNLAPLPNYTKEEYIDFNNKFNALTDEHKKGFEYCENIRDNNNKIAEEKGLSIQADYTLEEYDKMQNKHDI